MKFRSRWNPRFCEREYNNRALVPDFAEHIARWTEHSALVRRRSRALLDLDYSPPETADPSQRLDYFPAEIGVGRHGEPPPLLIFLHGGYWRALDKSGHSFVAAAFPRHGVAVAVPDYALCPAVTIEDITMQMVRCVAWLYRNAERLGFDRHRIHVAGHSAGGHLVAMLMTALWPVYAADLPADMIRSGTAISGLYDLEPLRHAGFLQADLRLTPESVARLSPHRLRPATKAPLITAVGGLESSEFIRQNALIGTSWPRNLVADVPLPGLHHFNVVDELADPASRLFQVMLEVMRAR